MQDFTYIPKGVCCREVQFSIEDGRLHNVSFDGGCNGNLQAISKLLEGADAQHAADILRGNDCRGRGTSCADQLAQALDQALEATQNK